MNRHNINPLANRRRVLTLLGGLLVAPKAFAQAGSHDSQPKPFASVVPGYSLRFPLDEGSHPDFRLEWWYITGWLNETTQPLGFQITFFQARPELKENNPSSFTPHHILIAHAALSDSRVGKLIHAQRAARAGFGLAGAEEGSTRVWIDDWSLVQKNNSFQARLLAKDFSFDFNILGSQPPLLQGADGFSRKGPAPESASYYYSLPHLKVVGTLTRDGKAQSVNGSAWLDHEWSSSYMAKEAVGWDWIGINLADGSALMVFRMRDKHGGSFWAGGVLRRADGSRQSFSPTDIRFIPRREWRSARTGASYPVSWLIKADDLELAIEPLMDDQENDTRETSGTIYWEGAVRALRNGNVAGLGYLELTGYWRPVDLQVK